MDNTKNGATGSKEFTPPENNSGVTNEERDEGFTEEAVEAGRHIVSGIYRIKLWHVEYMAQGGISIIYRINGGRYSGCICKYTPFLSRELCGRDGKTESDEEYRTQLKYAVREYEVCAAGHRSIYVTSCIRGTLRQNVSTAERYRQYYTNAYADVKFVCFIMPEYVDLSTWNSSFKALGPIERQKIAVAAAVCILKGYKTCIRKNDGIFVHCDLKTDNIFIDTYSLKKHAGRPRPEKIIFMIGDFNASHLTTKDGRIRKSSTPKGTPDSCCPYYAVYGGSVTVKNDIYSIGVCVYALVYNKLPDFGAKCAEGTNEWKVYAPGVWRDSWMDPKKGKPPVLPQAEIDPRLKKTMEGMLMFSPDARNYCGNYQNSRAKASSLRIIDAYIREFEGIWDRLNK